ncbi:MAG: hypothetical protein CME59_07010 [Halioglobus sp.]|nr:hypothetical protein [Halioglobus sp.]
MFWLAGIAFNIWIIFMGGAERLENTFLGYFEYGVAGENAVYIKVCAWVSLVFCVYFLAT